MKIVLLVMSILICFLIYLVVFFWLDRNFYRDILKIRSEFCDKIYALVEKSNDDWAELCLKHNKYWATVCAELQEENTKLKNQLEESEEDENVK